MTSDYRLLRGRFSFTRREEKAAKFTKRTPRTTIEWELFASFVSFWEDIFIDNIDDEYERLVEHLYGCTKKEKSFKTSKRRLPPETLELICDTELQSTKNSRRSSQDFAKAIKDQREKSRSVG
ncbi:hypothetical protein RB195_004571 [Necator americanus]|uniref:Uncharacterized protein n=1 Tax=Necator americanus TaxID=51031 RepID=A0ABR1BMK0_NECAM